MAMSLYDRGDLCQLEAYFGVNVTTLSADARPGATTITAASAAAASNYAPGDTLRIGGVDADGGETVTVASVSGRVVTLSAAVGVWHAGGSSVAKLAATSPVALEVRRPDGDIDIYPAAGAITNPSTGYYTRDVLLDASMEWAYRWSGASGAAGAGWRTLYVRADPFE